MIHIFFNKLLKPLILSILMLWTTSGMADVTGVLIPFYVYPTDAAIQPLLTAKSQHPTVPMRVILNPASGVGVAPDANYINAIKKLQQAGIQVAGYVYTNYDTRCLTEIADEIDKWYIWYQVNGIFLDAMGTASSYYQSMTAYAKSLGMTFLIGNPGANVDPSNAQLVNTVVVASQSGLPDLTQYANWQNAHLSKSSIAMLLYNVPTFPATFITQASAFVGWLYVTDHTGWDTLPTYFNQLLDALDTTIVPNKVGTMVPFYIYPTNANIQPIINTKKLHPNVPIRVILNPNSGVGASQDPAYINAITQFKKAGISVLGYVHTSYGQRSAADVKSEITAWVNWYKPDGIFLDEMGFNHSYYSDITSYAKNVGIKYVVGNPGTNIDVSAGNDVDTINIFEDGSLPDLTQFQSWYGAYPRSKISLLVYAQPIIPVVFVQQAAKHFGWIYITNDGLDNPWDTIPPYFESLVALLDTL